MGAAPGEVVLGSSTTANLRNLARGLAPTWPEDAELVVTDLEPRADIGLVIGAELGLDVRVWRIDPETARLDLDDLEPLLNPRTQLVAMTHCSNVVGALHDLAPVAERVHAAGALLCVDGVAFAPHRRPDVRRLPADFYAFSAYKTFGPHLGVLWGRRELLEACRGPNHRFIAADDLPYKFEPGGSCYELASSLPAIVDYLEALTQHQNPGSTNGLSSMKQDRTIDVAYDLIARHEERLAERLLDFLRQRSGIRIIGPDGAARDQRVSTVAFTAPGSTDGEALRSQDIPALIDRERMAIRWGHFYAPDAVKAMGLDPEDGIVRVSFVHYNSLDEVDRLIEAFDRVLPR